MNESVSPLTALNPEERQRVSQAVSGAFVSEINRIAAGVRTGGVPDTRHAERTPSSDATALVAAYALLRTIAERAEQKDGAQV